MNWWNAVLPVLTLILGWGLSLLAEERMDTRRARREQEQHDRERERAMEDRREEFELRSLSDLLAALTRLGRATMRFHLEDVRIAKETGTPYGSHQISDAELDEEVRLANQEVHGLIGLVMDDDLRQVVMDVHSRLNLAGLEPMPVAQAERLAAAAVQELQAAQRRLTERIRQVYAGTSGAAS